ncbi:hypothetical protein QW180_28470 [Vibrio sinaloensis]|nr:hypothetical protein [Vibrio sinaloensis]
MDWEYPGGGGLTTSPWNPATKLSDEQKKPEKAKPSTILSNPYVVTWINWQVKLNAIKSYRRRLEWGGKSATN